MGALLSERAWHRGPRPSRDATLGEDFIGWAAVGSVLQEVDVANFYAEFETELNA